MVDISLNDQVVEIMQINVRSLMEREQKLAELDNRAGKTMTLKDFVKICFWFHCFISGTLLVHQIYVSVPCLKLRCLYFSQKTIFHETWNDCYVT
jgi:hypothetical protein